MTFDLHAYLRERKQIVESALDERLPRAEGPHAKLHEAIRYSMLAPGKRLRPILTLAGAEAVGADLDAAIDCACALECIHVFSLIHDDLPCMDNDDYRRGRLTSHKVYGEALALLAGDALLALAFELIAGSKAPPARILTTLHMTARASGTWGMVGGQVADMESQGKPVTEDALRAIHAHKTGALLTAAVVSGALVGEGSDSQIDNLRSYGSHIGVAFQIADDILDVSGDEAKLGKPVGSDQERDKATYPRLFGLEESRRLAHAEVDAARKSLLAFDQRADPLRAIASYIVERDL